MSETDSGRRYRGISQEERREERRQKLIQAAIEIFGSKGYHASTVRTICQAAGVTERYFYESFSNSEELLCAAYDAVNERLHLAISAALFSAEHKEPAHLARVALHVLYESIQQDPAAARLQFIEILGVSPAVDERYRASVENFALLINSIASATGNTPTAGSEQQQWIATGLVGAVVTIAHRWIIEGFATPADVIVESAFVLVQAVVKSQQ